MSARQLQTRLGPRLREDDDDLKRLGSSLRRNDERYFFAGSGAFAGGGGGADGAVGAGFTGSAAFDTADGLVTSIGLTRSAALAASPGLGAPGLTISAGLVTSTLGAAGGGADLAEALLTGAAAREACERYLREQRWICRLVVAWSRQCLASASR